MGTSSKEVLKTDESLTTAYASGASTGVLDVGPYDSIVLLVELDPTGLTTVDMQFVTDTDKVIYKSDDGTLVLDEITHTVANDSSFALRIDTEALKTLEVQFKGDASGDIDEIAWSREGSKTHTPN